MIVISRLLLFLITGFTQASFFQPLRCLGHLSENSCYFDELCRPIYIKQGPVRDKVGMPLANSRRYVFCGIKSLEQTPEMPKPATLPADSFANLSATVTPTPFPTSFITSTPTTTTVTVVPSTTPTALPNNQRSILKTGNIEVASAESQVTFLLQVRDYPEYRAEQFDFRVTDPAGEVITQRDHLKSGIYFMVENSYQLMRINLPHQLNGNWSYSVEGPVKANVEVRSMSF